MLRKRHEFMERSMRNVRSEIIQGLKEFGGYVRMRRLAAGVLVALLALQTSESLVAQQAGTSQQRGVTPVQPSQQASLPDSPTPAQVDSQSLDQSQASTT